MSVVSIPVIAYEILKYVSYFELDSILPCFKLSAKDWQTIKQKIYKQRLTIHRDYNCVSVILQPEDLVNLRTPTEYKIEDKLHREDGPAVEREHGDAQWWVNGDRVSEL